MALQYKPIPYFFHHRADIENLLRGKCCNRQSLVAVCKQGSFGPGYYLMDVACNTCLCYWLLRSDDRGLAIVEERKFDIAQDWRPPAVTGEDYYA